MTSPVAFRVVTYYLPSGRETVCVIVAATYRVTDAFEGGGRFPSVQEPHRTTAKKKKSRLKTCPVT